MPTKEANKNRKEAFKDVHKKFGSGSVVLLGEQEPSSVPVIPTGLISLDYNIRHPNPVRDIALGGIPRGRITEMFGPEGGGKSTLLLRLFAQARTYCKRYCALIDTEHAFDPKYAEALGVDIDNLVVAQPSCGEEALEIANTLIESDSVDVLGIDSAAMLTARADLEAEMGDIKVGSRARLVTQALSKFIVTVPKHEVAVIFVNQVREQIGYSGYGDGTNTPCGRSLKHNASLRIETRRIGMLKISDKVVGGRIRFRIVKSRLDGPYRDSQTDLIFGEGFSAEGDLIDFAVERGVIKKSGATFEWSGGKFTRGREAFREMLVSDPQIAQGITATVMEGLERMPAEPEKKAVPDG